MRACRLRFTFLLLCLSGTAGQAAEFSPRAGDYGPAATHLESMRDMALQARKHATAAARARSVATVRKHTDAVFALVWGMPSGLLESDGAAAQRGWKTRWQVTYTDFDEEFGKRYGGAPPEVSDPAALGVAGTGRYVRRKLLADDGAGASTLAVVEALNNVIGWTRMDDGVTKAERQPRVDLTYRWDAPKAFWQGSADTGWLYEVQAQALNILKTDYARDGRTARKHAAALVPLIDKCLEGQVIEGVPQGGLEAAMTLAEHAGLL